MAIIGIVAIDQNLAIGKGGRLPWHYSADMKFFKQTTIGNAVVMGRRTWLTLKGPLKDRQNIVLSRDQNLSSDDSVKVVGDVESVLDFVRSQGRPSLRHRRRAGLRIILAAYSKMDCH